MATSTSSYPKCCLFLAIYTYTSDGMKKIEIFRNINNHAMLVMMLSAAVDINLWGQVIILIGSYGDDETAL